MDSSSTQLVVQIFGIIGAIVGALLLAIGIGYYCHALWAIKRQGMGMDYNHNIGNYRNRDSITIRSYRSCI
jgi:hypothetical protein